MYKPRDRGSKGGRSKQAHGNTCPQSGSHKLKMEEIRMFELA